MKIKLIIWLIQVIWVHGYVSNATEFGDDKWHSQDGYRSQLNCERPEIYICEEPEDTVPVEATKLCDYRNMRYHEQVYRWVAGRGCLFFTPPFLYLGGVNPLNLNSFCFYGNLAAPCLEVDRGDGTCACYPFDPGLEVVSLAVRAAMIPTPNAQSRWERCFHAAADCCTHVMLNNISYLDPKYCKATFDAWSCWETAPSGTRPEQICSELAYSNTGPTCHHFSSKECFSNGTWDEDTDYSTCSITQRLLRRYRFHIAILSVSIAFCLPAVFVFFFYKRLRVDRVILHRNLLIAIIARNVLVIISRSTMFIDEITNEDTLSTMMSINSVWCRTVSVLERFAGNTVFVCMLVEGIYLHRLIVAVFRKKLNINMLYGIGAVIAIIPVIVWSIVMALLNDHNCWVYYSIDHIQWSLDAPRLCILLLNTGLFLDILRVLLTKIRNSENVNQLNTTKATLFLMPIFGTQFLLTAFRPNTDSCTGEEAYFFITYTLECFQGIIVAILYCYVNKEVHTLVKTTYRKTESALKVRGEKNYRRPTGFGYDRRFTLSTAVPNAEDLDTSKDYAQITPKIHTVEVVSFQPENFAEVSEPVYESIDVLKRRDEIGDEACADYSKTSSIIDAKDWIKCVSEPSSSIYNNSLNDYEVNYLNRKFSGERNDVDSKYDTYGKTNSIASEIINENGFSNKASYAVREQDDCKKAEIKISSLNDNSIEEIKQEKKRFNQNEIIHDNSEPESDNDMINEIMQYFNSSDVILDPSSLSPNRKDDERIVFIE